MTLLQRYGTVLALVGLLLVLATVSPNGFARPSNLINITQQGALLAIVAFGATFAMAAGEFDLSVSSVASFGGVATVALLATGLGPAAAVPIALAGCMVVGVVSGILVARLGVPSFIATLAVGTIVGGCTFWASGGATLFAGVTAGFRSLARGTLFGVPTPTWWMLGTGLVAAVMLGRVEIGRRLYAIGGNPEAARLAGLPVVRDTIVAFAASALLAGLAGVLLAARLGSAHPTAGAAFLLQSYAAVFLGMTCFREGEPNIPGTLVGAMLIAVLANGLTILGVSNDLQDVATGAIILGA
ncbi:MAG: ABC transporter permease, partial [Actinomycetospora chiangmaiensis]|nr:ABC transporter permease [Actinomycetospora chiangmaiensis]